MLIPLRTLILIIVIYLLLFSLWCLVNILYIFNLFFVESVKLFSWNIITKAHYDFSNFDFNGHNSNFLVYLLCCLRYWGTKWAVQWNILFTKLRKENPMCIIFSKYNCIIWDIFYIIKKSFNSNEFISYCQNLNAARHFEKFKAVLYCSGINI